MCCARAAKLIGYQVSKLILAGKLEEGGSAGPAAPVLLTLTLSTNNFSRTISSKTKLINREGCRAAGFEEDLFMPYNNVEEQHRASPESNSSKQRRRNQTDVSVLHCGETFGCVTTLKIDGPDFVRQLQP